MALGAAKLPVERDLAALAGFGSLVEYEHPASGQMLHVDVKKVGRIPDGGGWAIHGRGTDEARASRRVANHRAGYVYIHAAVDDHSRMAYAKDHPKRPHDQKQNK